MISHASADDRFADHPGVRLLGAESYIGVPIVRRDGSVFGTLCALDTEPSALDPEVLETFTLLGELIAFELDAVEERRSSEAAEASRRTFVETVAHDLKTPLQVIKAQAQMIRRRVARGRELDPADLDRRLAEIEASVERGAGLLTEMLDAARLRSGYVLELERVQTDLPALVHEAVEMMRPASMRHAIELVTPDEPVVGLWDRSRLSRVLLNLLSNALRYSPEGGTVWVSVGCETVAGADWAVVAVRDCGIGIPAADLPTIFERYTRGANAAAEGTGIGLAGSRQIIEQHGGTITVDSTEGEGSIFSVRLPLA